MKNLLLESVEYQEERTRKGVWRRFLYPNGTLYAEYRSHATWAGLPLVHFTRGICPETGRRKTAKGVLAVGRKAMGIVAVGQAAAGVVAVGQLGLGLLFGVGQAATGLHALGQVAAAGEWAVGRG